MVKLVGEVFGGVSRVDELVGVPAIDWVCVVEFCRRSAVAI